MNFCRWKKLSSQQQDEKAKKWNLRKGEGQEIAAAILKAFIEQYGSNENIEIGNWIFRLRDNTGWGICVQCFNGLGFKTTPVNYGGIPISRFHIDHVDDGAFVALIPPKAWQRRTRKTLTSA